MTRTLRTLLMSLTLITLAALATGTIGCGLDGGNNINPKVNNPCPADGNCGEGAVCDPKVKICFYDCTVAGFKGCDKGNKCDTTLKRCVCNADDCKAPNVAEGSGCHPTKNICASQCEGADDCATGEKCMGEPKYCINPAGECKEDKECTDPQKPWCDTAATPPACKAIPEGSCREDKDCKAPTAKCKAEAGKMGTCVECLADGDCTTGPKQCDTATGACKKGPDPCTDTATCNGANPKAYCGKDKAAGCVEAKDCAEGKATKNGNGTWGTGEGSIVWGVTVQRTTDGSFCASHLSPKEPCQDASDCSGLGAGVYCNSALKHCLKPNKNGVAEVSFSYYNKAGKFPKDCGANSNKCVQTHSSQEGTAENLSVNGDGTSGTGTFGMCFSGSGATGTFQFWVKDTSGKSSNKACYVLQ